MTKLFAYVLRIIDKLSPAIPPVLMESRLSSVLLEFMKLTKNNVSGNIEIKPYRTLFKKFKRSEKSFEEDEKNKIIPK